MAWVAVDKDDKEYVYYVKPKRNDDVWAVHCGGFIDLPQGSIKKLIGRDLSWEDEPELLK